MTSFEELVELMKYMRGPKGCPWDREQTIEDFKKYLREESDEALEAIDNKDYDNLREELGDLLWHVVFISEIASEQGLFDIDEVVTSLHDKIVHRHPHVFAGVKADTSEDVKRLYVKIKENERKLDESNDQ